LLPEVFGASAQARRLWGARKTWKPGLFNLNPLGFSRKTAITWEKQGFGKVLVEKATKTCGKQCFGKVLLEKATKTLEKQGSGKVLVEKTTKTLFFPGFGCFS